MSTRAKKTDWTDLLLYGGIFLLLIVFIFQLLKLWNSSSGSFSNFFTSTIPQAVSNTLAAVEAGLTGAISGLNPFTTIANLLDNLPSFLSLLFSFVTSFVSALFGGTLFSSVASAITPAVATDQGNGSSYPATTQGTPTPLQNNSTVDLGDLNSFTYTLPQ